MNVPESLGIIAGNGVYPRLLADSARKAGVKQIVAAAFTGETDPILGQHVDLIEWMRVGQLGRLLRFFREEKVHHAIMAGQIAPKNLFDLHPDWKIAKEIARLNIGQTVIVKNGTIIAVEAFEGTNEAIRRCSALARKDAIMAKVAKPNQDMRFDVPVIGVETVRVAADAKLRVIATEAGKTLLLEKDAIIDLANRSKISIVARLLRKMQ